MKPRQILDKQISEEDFQQTVIEYGRGVKVGVQ